MPPELAPITVLPTPLVEASPAMLGALAIVATEACDELQWALLVMSWCVPSLYAPVAVNCCGAPRATLGLTGVMAIEFSVPLPTVNVVVPFTPPEEAVMVAVPLFLPNTRPPPRMDAIRGGDAVQTRPARLLPVLLSLKVPTAVNFIVVCR